MAKRLAAGEIMGEVMGEASAESEWAHEKPRGLRLNLGREPVGALGRSIRGDGSSGACGACPLSTGRTESGREGAELPVLRSLSIGLTLRRRPDGAPLHLDGQEAVKWATLEAARLNPRDNGWAPSGWASLWEYRAA